MLMSRPESNVARASDDLDSECVTRSSRSGPRDSQTGGSVLSAIHGELPRLCGGFENLVFYVSDARDLMISIFASA